VRPTPPLPIRPSAHLPICLLVACANVQPPPGGPPDAVPPELVSTVPESLAILPGFDEDVEFRFSEVVSEGSQPSQGFGTGDLERLVILSPTDKVPSVRWRRSRITVRPAEGWQPNRVYRVELLPGIADVRGNRGRSRRVLTFTTGAPAPTDSLVGTVIDWKAGRASPAALVEAVLMPDSLVYRAQADSSGNFHFGPLPRGEYLVFGVLDANRNLRREPREAFDSSRVAASSERAGDLYAFVHDTLPPRIQTVAPTDSVTAAITFAAPLDPAFRLDTAAVTLRKLPDSTAVGIRALRLPQQQPPAQPQPREAGDSIERAGEKLAREADTVDAGRPTGAPRKPTPPDSGRRPALNDRLVIEAAEPWKPGDRFALTLRGVRTVSGTSGDVTAPLIIPEEKKAVPPKQTPDSASPKPAEPDSAAAPPEQ
jgi:Big-like domain-containing protein